MNETLQERLRWLSRHIVMTASKDCLTGAADALDRLYADRAPHEKDFWAIAEQRDRFGAERDALERELRLAKSAAEYNGEMLDRKSKEYDALAAELKDAREALAELHALVWGECPSLLNEDSGGNATLDLRIRAALAMEPTT